MHVLADCQPESGNEDSNNVAMTCAVDIVHDHANAF